MNGHDQLSLFVELCEKIFWFETAALIYAIMRVFRLLSLLVRQG